jgi:hypothetical protein
VAVETGAEQFFLGDAAMAAAVAEQLDVGVGVGVGGGGADLDGDGAGVDRDGAADGPVLAVGVVAGELLEPGLGAADGADTGLRGGWMLIPLASKSYRPRLTE